MDVHHDAIAKSCDPLHGYGQAVSGDSLGDVLDQLAAVGLSLSPLLGFLIDSHVDDVLAAVPWVHLQVGVPVAELPAAGQLDEQIRKRKEMRKTKPKKRILLPDPKFNDVLVTRFVNDLMVDGKKTVAFKIFYDALDIVEEKMAKKEEKSALEIWKQALENITPQVEVKSRRVGGATFQVPTEINPARKRAISVKNMILYSRKRSGHSMAEKLSAEIMAAYKEEGAAFKKKEDTHRMAEANRAFAHFRF